MQTNNKDNNDFYFSNNESTVAQMNKQIKKEKKMKNRKPAKKGGVGSTYLFFIIVIAVSVVVSIYAIFCMNDILAITKTKSNVTVSYSQEIESSNEAIDMLHKKGLIRCKNFCKFFVKLRDSVITTSRLGGPYEPGMYYLNGKMGLEGMLITLKGNTVSSETVTLTFPEGYTVPEIINKLSDNDVCDKAALISVIQSTDFSYSLVTDLKANDNVPYRLEGFMFPDTYEFYINESASSVVRKFLENGENKFTEEYKTRASEMNYSIYEIMTVASIVEKEAANDDQKRTIAAIIYNRLEDKANFPTLGCLSTSDYITNKVAPNLSSTSSHTAEYYLSYYNTNNTSTVVGLPAGPICNPGTESIYAALYPESTNDKFFFHDTKGNMYTAATYQEFKSKVQKYAPYLEY